MNYWDNLSGDDEHAADYMLSYGEGPNCPTRHTLGSFINDGESVLDVGCGPGWNWDHFREYGPRIGKYKGLDYSERFVRVANQRFFSQYPPSDLKSRMTPHYKSTPFQKGDVRHIVQPDNSWDVVIMQDVLEHTNGYEQPVKEALRVAKKRAIFTFWHMIENEGTEHINDDGDDGWGAWYERGKWEKFLDSLGYSWFYHELIYPKEPPRLRDYYIVDKEEPK